MFYEFKCEKCNKIIVDQKYVIAGEYLNRDCECGGKLRRIFSRTAIKVDPKPFGFGKSNDAVLERHQSDEIKKVGQPMRF